MTSVQTQRVGDKLRVTVSFNGVTPVEALSAWTRPELVLRWWAAGQLTIDPVPGGIYNVFFGMGDQTLTGRIRHLDPAGSLSFGWCWAHESDAPERVVTIDITSTETGSNLVFTQGPYGDTEEEQEQFDEHDEGWAFFLDRMKQVLEQP